MPVFHFTFHAYRSWNADHPRGWVQHGEAEVQKPSRELAWYREGLANHPEVRFTAEQQGALVGYAREICGRRAWVVYGISADATHVHVVVGWRGEEAMEKVRDAVKRVMGFLLAKAAGTNGKPWFSHGQDETPVEAMGHLRYLLYEYLPKHLGAFWRRELE